ncbi:MAG TPA: RNA polymerase sporulation sigma factor SigK [Candidatus Scatovivens faecipullorum]|nr:RNA polymerase sporulation sigma factor SigK [Candidatus Scatovivens faecipullorum]
MFSFSISNLFVLLGQIIFGVGYIQSGNLFPEPLTQEEEKVYLTKMKNGDEEARNILIERNLRLVAHVAKKYSSSNIDQDDLISIGSIGLIKGINSFDMDKSFKLATYIAKCIENEILMYLRSNKKRASDVYLNEPIGKDKDDNEVTLQEVLENNERNVEDEVDLKFKVKRLYEKMKKILKDREKIIIELRFGLNGQKPKTQKEIAKMMNISRSYVSRIESKAIGKLAKEIKE